MFSRGTPDSTHLRILAAQRVEPMLVQVARPRLKRQLARLEIAGKVLNVPPARQPHAGQIWPAIRHPWRRCVEIGLAVRQAGNAGRGELQPLSGERDGQQNARDQAPDCILRLRKGRDGL